MKEGAINCERAVIAHDQAPKVSEPGVGSFDDRRNRIVHRRPETGQEGCGQAPLHCSLCIGR